MSTVRDVALALSHKGLEVLEADEKTTQLRIMARLHRSFGDHWKLVMHRLLTNETRATWKVDISKKYFLRGSQVFFGWRLLFQGDGITACYAEIINIIKTTPPPSNITVDEVPLIGSSPNRNTRTNVGSVDKVLVGPLAVRR